MINMCHELVPNFKKPYKRLKRLLYIMYRKEGIQISDIKHILEDKGILLYEDSIKKFIKLYEFGYKI